jgi:hypothetical protein
MTSTTAADLSSEPSTEAGRKTGTGHAAKHPRAAAEKAARHNEVHVSLPVIGRVELPAADELAFLAGVAVLAAACVVEWPIALVIVAGHTLASRRHNRVVREFGEALERV